MAEVRFIAQGKFSPFGRLIIDGHEMKDVIAVAPNLFDKEGLASVTVTFLVESFEYVPAEPEQVNGD